MSQLSEDCEMAQARNTPASSANVRQKEDKKTKGCKLQLLASHDVLKMQMVMWLDGPLNASQRQTGM